MNCYGGKELAGAFRTVRKNTLIIAEEIPEEKFGYQAAPETRSVGRMLVHIALGPGFQAQIHRVERRTTLEGMDFPALVQRMIADEQAPRTKAQIVALLRDEGDRFAQWLEGLSDDFLAEQVAMPAGMTPAAKSRFEMLLGVKEHEMHHRAQLMLIERMLGMVPHLTREMQARFGAATAAKTAS